MKKSIQLKTLYDIQIANKSQIADMDNEDDAIKASLCMMITHLSQMIPILASEGFVSPSKSKPLNPILLKNSTVVIENLIMLCNASNVDIPEDDFLEFQEVDMPYEEKNDSILGVMAAIGCVADLTNLIYVDLQGPVWEQYDIPPDFEINVAFIILAIKHLGAKHGFTINDILLEMR